MPIAENRLFENILRQVRNIQFWKLMTGIFCIIEYYSYTSKLF